MSYIPGLADAIVKQLARLNAAGNGAALAELRAVLHEENVNTLGELLKREGIGSWGWDGFAIFLAKRELS